MAGRYHSVIQVEPTYSKVSDATFLVGGMHVGGWHDFCIIEAHALLVLKSIVGGLLLESHGRWSGGSIHVPGKRGHGKR